MLIKRPADIRSSEITDKKTYLNRREFVRAATGTAALAAAGALGAEALLHAQPPAPHRAKLENVKPSEFSTKEKPNTWEQITTYNNYYEYGTDKDSPAYYAGRLKPSPWSVLVEGLAASPGRYEGKARIVRGPADFGKLSRGDVLVARTTSPAFSIILPIIGGVVTDRGGALCHAAIVAREFGIPAVVGTNQGTAKIPDGAQVLVDGDRGFVTVRL